MNTYKALDKQVFQDGPYSIVPIRSEDRYRIMEWRNEQIYHLRQNQPLTKATQDHYFDVVVAQLFSETQPKQFLFSFLEGEKCIGYGGLVHINWIDRHAEISFIMETALEKEHFHHLWSTYLGLIESFGFEELGLHKLFVYAFDLRPHLYAVLEDNNYFLDARLKDHCFFEGEFKDVVIHSKTKGV